MIFRKRQHTQEISTTCLEKIYLLIHVARGYKVFVYFQNMERKPFMCRLGKILNKHGQLAQFVRALC